VPMSLRKRSYPSPLFRLMTKKLESGDILNPRLKSRPSVSSTLPKPLADWPLRAATAAERTVYPTRWIMGGANHPHGGAAVPGNC
jgi:hypothetical protein